MATLTVFDKAKGNFGKAVFNLASDTLKVMLTDVAPVASGASGSGVLADITEIAAGNGYVAGGASLVTPTYTETGTGTSIWELTAASPITWTATGGAIAQFRYVVLYDFTVGSPVKPLIGFLDYGSEVNLA